MADEAKTVSIDGVSGAAECEIGETKIETRICIKIAIEKFLLLNIPFFTLFTPWLVPAILGYA